MRSKAIRIAAAIGLLLSVRAEAQSYPARSGETGILDVPDSETAGAGGGQLATEFRFDHVRGQPNDVGPLPIYVVAGVAPAVDLGLTMREWGQPGDERPARPVFGAAAKLQLWAPGDGLPGLALSGVFDRFNANGVVGARVAVSNASRLLRVAAFLGAEAGVDGLGDAGATGGLAASVAVSRRVEIAAEALTGPRGENFGVALRWSASPTLGIALGGNYLPGEEGFRLALTVAMSPAQKPRARAPEPAPLERVEEPPVAAGFTDERPRFRLRLPTGGPALLAEAHPLQHGPRTPRAAAAGEAGAARPGAVARPAAPALDDRAEAQLREQETLADARERRARSAAEQLDVRARAAAEEQKRLASRERELADREQQLDARERRIAFRGPPTQQQRQLESLEAQLASEERNLSAQERSYVPALDAARGRERDAAVREEAERKEAVRLTASAGGAGSPAARTDVRKQAMGAKNRQVAALEAGLVAKGELVDALERQNRTKADRLGAGSRRLEARTERLDLLERLSSEPKASPAAPKTGAGAAAPPKGKAAFAMVVKSPTAVLKERPAAPDARAAGPTFRPGAAAEKAVAAAAVLIFPTPATRLSELDVEGLANVAKLAARERYEVLIWARAKDPGLMAEAQRRAAEIQTRVLAAAPLDPKQVVTRITTRPGANGIDVVVSALRETVKAAPAAAAPQAPRLLAGESGNRQIREAVQVAQRSIEACVGEHVVAKRLARAEGILKLTVGAAGRVTRVTSAGELSGTQVEDCLNAAAKGWTFPAADGEYVVDVPITVIRGGAK